MSKSKNEPEAVIPKSVPRRQKMTKYEADLLMEVQAAEMTRRIEALKLYRPMPQQKVYHESKASIVVAYGGNRSGKSCCAFVEDARAAMGCDPFKKYPERDGVMVIVGQNWKQVGLVIYPMLFKAGAFKIIRDAKANEWRSYNPLDPEDVARRSECKPAPPLIPPRAIKTMSFINRREGQISTVEMNNGWVIKVFSSDGEIPQGFPCDHVHIDEDVEREEWVGEMQARLSDRHGNLHWSAMPHGKNDALTTLLDMAEAQEEEHRDPPDVVRFQFDMDDNPHIDDDEKRKRKEEWAAQGEDILNMRLRGEVGMSALMYPGFHPNIHGTTWEELGIEAREIPADWCRYMVVDPGSQVCGVLFAVVPPPSVGDFVLLEGELKIKQCNAKIFGERVEAYLTGKSCRAFIIDEHGGALRDIGSGKNVKDQYVAALRERKVASETTGHNFVGGCDDVLGRAEALRLWIHSNRDGSRKLKILSQNCPQTIASIRRFKRKIVKGLPDEKPNTRGDVHMVQTVEYLAAYDPKYHRPRDYQRKRENPQRTYLREKRKRNRQPGSSFVTLGPQS